MFTYYLDLRMDKSYFVRFSSLKLSGYEQSVDVVLINSLWFEHFEWEVDPVVLLLLKFNSDSLIVQWTILLKSSLKFASETLIDEWTRTSYEKVTSCFCQVTCQNVQSLHTYKRTIQLNLFATI